MSDFYQHVERTPRTWTYVRCKDWIFVLHTRAVP